MQIQSSFKMDTQRIAGVKYECLLFGMMDNNLARILVNDDAFPLQILI